MSFHEEYRRKEKIAKASERSFGLVIASVLMLLGLYKSQIYLISISVVVLLLAFFRPSILNPLNFLWHNLGLMLHKVMSPIILFVLFYAVFVPMGLMMRLFGKRPLVMSTDKEAQTYWRASEESDFKNQF